MPLCYVNYKCITMPLAMTSLDTPNLHSSPLILLLLLLLLLDQFVSDIYHSTNSSFVVVVIIVREAPSVRY